MRARAFLHRLRRHRGALVGLVLAVACLVSVPLGLIGLVRVLTHHQRAATVDAGPRVGAAVRDGPLTFVVDGVRCHVAAVGPSDSPVRPEHGQFCRVEMTIRDVGAGPVVFEAAAQRATGSGGAFYLPIPAADLAVNGASDAIAPPDLSGDPIAGDTEAPTPAADPPLKPGESRHVTLVYDLPPGVALTAIELHTSAYTPGVTVTLP